MIKKEIVKAGQDPEMPYTEYLLLDGVAKISPELICDDNVREDDLFRAYLEKRFGVVVSKKELKGIRTFAKAAFAKIHGGT